MKLIKKLILLAILTMIFTLPAQAEVMESYIDDFEGKVHTDRKGYPMSEGVSDVIVLDASYTPNYAQGSLVTAVGLDGEETTVFRKAQNANDFNLQTILVDNSSASVTYELSYDVKISANADMTLVGGLSFGWTSTNQLFQLKSDGMVHTTTDGTTYSEAAAYETGKWYRIVYRIKGLVAEGWMLDSEGNTICYSKPGRQRNGAADNRSISIAFLAGAQSNKTTLDFDNVQLLKYDSTVNKPSVMTASIEEGQTNVARNCNIEFKFDQPIDENFVVTLTKTGGGTASASLTGINPITNTATVVCDVLLDKKSEYTLEFPNTVVPGESTSYTITFETEDLHLWNDMTVSAASENSLDPTKTDITFNFGDEFNYSKFTGAVLAVCYQGGKMMGADIVALTGATVGETTSTFALSGVSAGATIKLILLDTDNHPIPLASGELAVN